MSASHNRLLLLAATWAGVLLGPVVGRAEPPALAWKAGAASVKITPDSNLWMAGYAARTKPAEGVELDLYAKALVIEDRAGLKWALVTLDLIGVPRNVRLFVAGQAEKQFAIAPSHLVLNASHTHSGPELRTDRVTGTDDLPKRQAETTAYTEKLQTTLVKLIGEAVAKSAPVSVQFCQARCGFAMNRRTPQSTGGWANFPNPDGPVDHSVPVLRVMNAEGKDVAFAFGYSCHCTTLGHQKFSGDYAGYAQQYLEATHPGVVALFVNGCSGDQNPYPRRTMELAQTHGRSLATAVEAALTTKMKPLGGGIRAAYREIPLAYDTLPTAEQLTERAKSTNKLDAAHANRVLARLKDQGKLSADYPYPVQVVRLGDELTWITLGGEVVVDYSLRLKKEIGDPIIWVSGYSNDVMGYIPSLRVWREGGYEGGDAMKWGSHPNRWSNRTEEHIVGTVHELRRSLK